MTEVFMGNSKQYMDEFRAEAERQVDLPPPSVPVITDKALG
ncbi:hypothetical protein [Xanthomonas translucens]|nr:hypothetical protein [Xanthomonas translucens]